MRITAKLAYSQLKTNRSRTLWTLTGIMLSTALITAVCTFAASGNALLVNTFGEGSGYGGYGKSFMGLLLVPAIFFCFIIVSMSVVVVSNIFRVSANERTVQFGILKSVGAARKQIMETVMYESIFVSAAGIPAGVILGLILAFGGISVANHYLDELNSLVHMMMTEITLTVELVVTWQALLAALLISFLTVLFSAWLPAKKASNISAIDSIRSAGEYKLEVKKLRTNPLVQRLFGFEGTLAVKNMKRNRRVFRATVISLTVGTVLLVTLASLSQQAKKLEDIMSHDVDATIVAEYTSAYSTKINQATGREETVIEHPIHSKTGNEMAERLRAFGNTKTFGIGDDMETYDAVLSEEQISIPMKNALSLPEGQKSYELSVEIITVDEKNYELLCKQAKVPLGSNILLNHYSYNDNGTEVSIVPFLLEGKSVRLFKADGSVHEILVHGVLTEEEIPKEFFYPNTRKVRLVVAEAYSRGYTCYSDPVDLEEFTSYANRVMEEMFPNQGKESYMEAGFNTRVYKIDDYVRVMNMAIVVSLIFMYSFAALLMLIGLTSIISTMSTNVLMRSREFAVLRSVGMTPEGLWRMLKLESILCALKALFYGLPIAILLTYGINLPVRKLFPIPYELPWLAMIFCVGVVFLVTWASARCAARRLRNRNIIETIRAESGR